MTGTQCKVFIFKLVHTKVIVTRKRFGEVLGEFVSNSDVVNTVINLRTFVSDFELGAPTFPESVTFL